MFVDFDEVFNNKPLPQIQLPDAFISYLNQKLPEGFKYTVDADGNCIVTTDSGSFTLGGFEYKLTSDDKMILGKNFSQDDILHLFYNRQKPIPLQLEKDGHVLLNGTLFPVEKLLLNPHNPIKTESGKFFMAPEPFPNPFRIKLGCTDYEREVLVHRVPHNSINIEAFMSEETEPLKIEYFIDQTISSLSLTLSLNLVNAKTVRDIVESTKIYNAYLAGEGYFCGHPLPVKINGTNVKSFENSSIIFWEKVLKLEENLGVVFTPPLDDVDFDTMCLVERLYQNLILHNPIRDSKKPDALNGEWEPGEEMNFDSYIGSNIYFEFEATGNFELFGEKIVLYGLMGILDAIFADIARKGKAYKILFNDLSENRPRYTVSQFFKDREEMIAYKATDHNKRIKAFQSAKQAREYLTEE